MINKTKVNLGITQETLSIPLWARAEELKQADPIVVDPKSAQMLEAIDYDFNKFVTAKGSQVGICLRGLILDRWVRTYLEQNPQGLVVELGAGLNTRFDRVDNGQVHWFDLDLPDVMALRQQFFQESDRRQFITASALDPNWCECVKAAGERPCMFVAEGVLMYFSEEQVKQLFANLLQHFRGSWFAFDSMSALWVKNQKRHDAMKNMPAKFDWGISDIRTIQSWNSCYQVTEVLTFRDLPAKYFRRFSLLSRVLFSLPSLRNSYRMALVRLG